MNHRLRVPAALLALFALFAYLGGSVWAGTCPPAMGGHDAGAAPVAGTWLHAQHHAPSPSSDDAESPRDEAPACPVAMGGAGCVSVLVPAAGVRSHVPAPDRMTNILFHDHTHGRLAIAAPFRPPRA